MKQIIQKNKTFIAALAGCLLIAVITMSFQNEAYGVYQKFDTLGGLQDTFPTGKGENNTMTRKEFDALAQKLDIDMKQAGEELKKTDWTAVSKQIDVSMAQVDFKQVEVDIANAMKEIDFDKLNKEINAAMKNIDWTKLSADVSASLQEAKEQIKKIDMTELKIQMEKAKLELAKSKALMNDIDIDKTITEAMKSVVKAKEELSQTSQLFTALEKDGLINRKDGFTIEYRNKALFINGKQQSASVTNKYKRFLNGDHFNITIENE